MGVQFERGDLVAFRHLEHGAETQSAGIVVDLEDGLLTIALPHGVEVWNMRSSTFGSAWRIEHTPGAMTEEEVLAFAVERLEALHRRPIVVVEPGDDRPFTAEPHSHAPGDVSDHHHHEHVEVDSGNRSDGAASVPARAIPGRASLLELLRG